MTSTSAQITVLTIRAPFTSMLKCKLILFTAAREHVADSKLSKCCWIEAGVLQGGHVMPADYLVSSGGL